MIGALITARARRRLQAAGLSFLTAGCVAIAGCQKRLDPGEYGEIIYRSPKVAGVEKPYPLPELDEPEETQVGPEK